MSEQLSESGSLSGDVQKPTTFEQDTSMNAVVYSALAVIGVIVCGQAWLVFNLNINWDEFYHLSVVHEHLRGTMDRTLQTFHAHLFGWLGQLQIGEAGQITVGRSIMLACECGTAGLIYLIARRFVVPWAAVMGVLAYLTAGFTMKHGMSFRADPLSAFLLMLCLYFVIATPLKAWQVFIAGLSGALAVLVTIKSVLYLPAFIAALIWRLQVAEGGRDALKRIFATGVVGLALLGVLYFWHASQVNPADFANTSTNAGGAAAKAFLDQELMPRRHETMHWARGSLIALVMIVFGFVGATRNRAIVLALLVAPLLSVLFYRNSFPYFFPFITAPAMVVAAVGAKILAVRRSAVFAAIALMVMGSVFAFARASFHGQVAQRETLAAVHAMFAEPVSYIDRNASVASFPHAGFIMTTWAVESYRLRGNAVFRETLKTDQPRFLIANSPIIEGAVSGEQKVKKKWQLLDEDAAVLHGNFVHHWGVIWVAGKSLDVVPESLRFEVIVAGPYTLESEVAVRLDGQTIAPGEMMELSAGEHEVSAETSAKIVLRWGENLYRPDFPATEDPFYFGF